MHKSSLRKTGQTPGQRWASTVTGLTDKRWLKECPQDCTAQSRDENGQKIPRANESVMYFSMTSCSGLDKLYSLCTVRREKDQDSYGKCWLGHDRWMAWRTDGWSGEGLAPLAKLIIGSPDGRRGSILQWYSGSSQCVDCVYSSCPKTRGVSGAQ